MNLSFGRLTRLVADSSLESDGKLLAAYLNGSQPAFRQLVDRHGPLVFGVCLRILRHQQDAEDGDEPGSQPKPDQASLTVAKAPDQLNTTRKQVEGTSTCAVGLPNAVASHAVPDPWRRENNAVHS